MKVNTNGKNILINNINENTSPNELRMVNLNKNILKEENFSPKIKSSKDIDSLKNIEEEETNNINNKNNNALNYEILVKIEKLTRDLKRITKLNEDLENNYLKEKEAKKKIEREKFENQQQLNDISKKYKEILITVEDFKKKHETFMNEKLFYIQVKY